MSLDLKVMTQDQTVFDARVVRVNLPGIYGFMEIHPGHASMVCQLGTGELHIETSDKKLVSYFVSGGFCSVESNEISMMVDIIEEPSGISLERAKDAESRAEKRLEKQAQEKVELSRALAALAKAKARIKLSSTSR